MARCNLGTTAAPVDFIERLCEGQFELRGMPGASQLFGALLPPDDLHAEAVEAQCARGFEQLLISEAIPRLPGSAPGANWFGAPGGTGRALSLTTGSSSGVVEVGLLLVCSQKDSGSHASSRNSSTAQNVPTEALVRGFACTPTCTQ